ACFGALAVIPPLLLLFVVRNSTLHPNCRFLISLWTTSQIVLNLLIFSYGVYFTFVEYETMAVNQYEPPMRGFYVYNAIRVWYICSGFELGISLER
ncbi:hypothetical protein PFISCL1PPCAC_16765, partial [Pristionchus fissidentatus]